MAYRCFNFGRERCGGHIARKASSSRATHHLRPGRVRPGRGTFASGIQGFGVQTAPPREDGSGIDPPIVAEHRAPLRVRSNRTSRKFMQDAIGQNQVLVPPMGDGLWSPKPSRTKASSCKPHVVDCVLDPQRQKPVSRVGVQQYKRAIDPRDRRHHAQLHAVGRERTRGGNRHRRPGSRTWPSPGRRVRPETAGGGETRMLGSSRFRQSGRSTALTRSQCSSNTADRTTPRSTGRARVAAPHRQASAPDRCLTTSTPCVAVPIHKTGQLTERRIGFFLPP